MAFHSLNHVLGSLEGQYKQKQQQQLQQVLGHWQSVVGVVVAAQTRPISVQRGVLKVATSSSAWAQNLVFERQRILEKLNQVLSRSLTDIRFSTAQWAEIPLATFPGEQEQTALWQDHPSRLPAGTIPLSNSATLPSDTPLVAFQQWATLMRSRTNHLPHCPQCHSPTPIGELERWQICSLCVAKRW
ncbi:DciA family protein [Leptolyngbyaceae cyanobacterium UHCC 1019]